MHMGVKDAHGPIAKHATVLSLLFLTVLIIFPLLEAESQYDA